ncbi:conserved hypothetical protein [Formosa agariphila KMM 3901]|uniref:Gliding motility-associated C-terminal domain-containing protein n=1 Tax=Formosa agariphila (strain DSM 15362 / KCTC 12365 / LMG 23005 / KMM 3901 / M-2Alg 35-1) TaxID=1347342 RepID=T2KHX4_FORAG|nr:T9SS type B sorting domain-containing protein [Formosa agariphila]CDF78457.1 conserved hypothetical protein [Formosa agariphila KMM 3901]
MRISSLYTTIILLLLCCSVFGQKISVTPSNNVDNLINTHLISGNAIQIFNPQSPKNSNVSGESFSSFGSFQGNTNNFPFENGIFLTTGNANEAGNTDVADLNSGSTSWEGDSDLEAELGISNTYNATVLEFDFVALTETIAFDYVLASHEYEKNTICDYADGFAILIQEQGSTTFDNIAVTPDLNNLGTTIPVNTQEINGNVCAGKNIEYYENEVSQLSSTNFFGRTKALTVTYNITPYKKYKIKFIVADQNDVNFDTAVFIKQSEVNIDVNLGNDISTCTDTELIPELQSDFGVDKNKINPMAYTWYKDGNPAPVSNAATYTATTAGIYSVELQIYEPDCLDNTNNPFTITDDIEIDIIPNDPIPLIPDDIDAARCSSTTETFKLTDYNDYVKNQIPNNGNSYTVSYSNAAGNTISEVNIAPGNSETITATATQPGTACAYTFEFPLSVNQQPAPTPQVVDRCDNDLEFSLDFYNDLFITGDLANFTVTYHYTEYQAIENTHDILSPYLEDFTELHVRVENNDTGCFGTTTLSITDIESPKLNDSSSTVSGCSTGTSNDLQMELDDALNALLVDTSITYIITYFNDEDYTTQILDITAYLDTDPSVIYVRVESDINNDSIGDGCPAFAEIDIYPSIITDFPVIEDYAICGGDTFNLVQIAEDIKNGVSSLVVTFYDSDSNVIPQVTDYTIPDLDGDGTPDNSQTIHVKVEDPGCGNYETVFDIFKAPAIDYKERPFIPTICSSDRIIDLNTYKGLIVESTSNVTIQYYLSAEDRDLDQNRLPQYLDYTTIIDNTLYARVMQRVINGTLEGSCYDAIEFTVDILEMPQVNLEYTYFQYCVTNSALEVTFDTSGALDTFNLDAELMTIIADNPNNSHISEDDIDIKFYETLADAEAGNSNFIDTNGYTTTSKTIYSRVTNKQNTTICSVIDPINIEVFLEPEFNKTDFFACDVEVFPLNSIALDDLLVNYVDTEIEVNYYDEKGALYLSNASIDVPYGTTVTIYATAININNSKCSNIDSDGNPIRQPITLETAETPDPVPFDLPVCVVSGQENTEIDLSMVADNIENVAGVPLEISFYQNKADAEASQYNFIDTSVPYSISTSQTLQNLFVQIKNPGTECFIVQTMLIKINDIPDFTKATIAPSCATDYIGDNILFDLSESILDINVKTGYKYPIIYYFEDENDANTLNLSNQITNSLETDQTYIKPITINTIYVVAQDPDNDCYEIQPLELLVNYPPPTKDISEFQFCEDGTGILDLSVIDNQLVYDLNASTITYHKTSADAYAGSNPLKNIYDYVTNGLNVFPRVQDNINGCFIVKPITLIPNPNAVALNVTATATFFQNSNTITVTASGGAGNYWYSLDNGQFQTSNIFENATIGERAISVKDESGCGEGYTTVVVIDIPKFFTPNQDGFHDTWHIIGIESLDQVEIKIFDRYGKLLKILNRNNNPTFETGWDGTYNGAPMPTNDYWYTASINHNGRYFKRKGHFTLKR